LSENVDFLGERNDVAEILGGTDLLLAPSWEEPLGRSVIEAMAMEVPVLATSVGGPAELIREGEDGFLLQPRQPSRWVPVVRRLLVDPQLRASMGKKARERAHRFGVPAHVAAIMAAYEEALALNTGGRAG
jgi:glycosyltransferase involved in cell wall biosynthesis